MSEKKGEYKVKRGNAVISWGGNFTVAGVVIVPVAKWDEMVAQVKRLEAIERIFLLSQDEDFDLNFIKGDAT